MSSMSALGIGSGLDLSGMLDQIMALEQRPLTALVRKEASYNAKLSAFGQMQSVLASLQSAANGLKDAAKFAGTKATVGGDAGFTAASGANAAAASYAVQVDRLATVQRVASSATEEFAPSAGGLKITFGTVDDDGINFVPDSERTATLDFTGSTLEELRDAINADSTLGIKANVVNNGDVKQLVFTGTGTGADKAFQIEGVALEGGENGLTGLNYTPGVGGGMYSLQNAQDARLNIDGIDIRRGSNTVGDAIEDVTITLTKETTQPATLSIAEDRSAARSSIDAFVKAYNDSIKLLKDLTSYNAETKEAAVLTGDATARGIQNQLRAIVGGTFDGLGDTRQLADIGLSFQRDGTLTVDSTKLSAALDNPASGITEFFTGMEGKAGFAERVSMQLDGYLGSDGLLKARTEGIDASVKAIDQQRETLLRRLESVEKRYRAQFSALDSMVASMTQTSNWLSQQLANLPKIG